MNSKEGQASAKPWHRSLLVLLMEARVTGGEGAKGKCGVAGVMQELIM
jgi:hypothetical protein